MRIMNGTGPDLFSRLLGWAGGLLGRPGPARALDWAGRRAGIAILVLGLAVFLLAQGYVTVYPSLVKEVPPEADDAFAYITKAVQMKECFFQGCPALRDLLAQTEDKTSDARPLIKFQIFSKTVLIYHPLHSALMVGLEGLGFSWEGAYVALWVVGFLLMTASVAFLLSALFGQGGAGLALMILPFFRNDGIDFIIPNSMVTALAMLLWSAALTRVRCLPYLIVAGALIMLPLHMIGIVHLAFLLLLYWLTAEQLRDRTRIRTTLVCLGLAGIYLALPLILSRPVLSVGAFGQSWHGPLALFPENFKAVVTTLIRLVNAHGGYVICGLLLGIGAVFNTPLRKHRIVLVLWMCLGLVAASFLPRAPIPSNAFHRILAPCLVFFCGLMGRAAWVWLKESGAWLLRALTGIGPREIPVGEWSGWKAVGLVVVGLVLVRVFVFGALEFRASAAPVVDHIISRKDYRFLPEQVELLASRARPGAVVYYRNLVPMQYYLNHGALKFGAVLEVLLSSDPEQREAWLRENPPEFVVTGSPFWGLSDGRPYDDRPIYQHGGALILPGTGIQITLSEPRLAADLEFLVEWPGRAGQVRLASGGKVYPLQTDDQNPGRLKVRAPEGASQKRYTLKGTEPVRLLGLSLDRGQASSWPWNRGVAVRTVPSSASVEAREIQFDTALLNPLTDRNLEVLDDRGSSILFGVVPR